MTEPWDGRYDDSDAKDGFELPPEGNYIVEIVGAEKRTSSKGDGMIALVLKVANGPHDGHELRDNWMMTGKGSGIGRKKAQAFGIELRKGELVNEFEFIGRRAVCYATHDTYTNADGKKWTNLKADINQGDFCGYDPLIGPVVGEDVGEEDGAARTPGEDYDFDDIPF
jgi:hypothetical protein